MNTTEPMKYIMDNLADPTALSAIIAIMIAVGGGLVYMKVKLLRTKHDKRKECQLEFSQAVKQLSSSSHTAQMAAAVVLRRFFNAEIDADRFRKETIGVLSSQLRIYPRGVFQKIVGDGLAWSGNLNYSDLMNTNLQNLYLGVKNPHDDEIEKLRAKEQHLEKRNESPKKLFSLFKVWALLKKKSYDWKHKDSWKLAMDFTDFFEADLTDALIENAKGFSTIFYNAILANASIKNCEFINADFRCANLLNARFDNVVLTGSKFKGAVNIPDDIKAHLDDNGVFDDTINRNKGITTANPSPAERKKIFFSMPGSLSQTDKKITDLLQHLLGKKGYQPFFYTRDHYPESSQLSKVRQKIDQSVGMIAFGFKQIQINKGVARPELELEEDMSGKWLPSPWNDIEVGMAMMKEIPVLMIKDDDINIGVFDKAINENKMITVSTAVFNNTDGIAADDNFNRWLELLAQQG